MSPALLYRCLKLPKITNVEQGVPGATGSSISAEHRSLETAIVAGETESRTPGGLQGPCERTSGKFSARG
jgi:hypothetical protein